MPTVKEILDGFNNTDKLNKDNAPADLRVMIEAYGEQLEDTNNVTIKNYEFLNPLNYDSQVVQYSGYYNTDNRLYGVMIRLSVIESWYNGIN